MRVSERLTHVGVWKHPSLPLSLLPFLPFSLPLSLPPLPPSLPAPKAAFQGPLRALFGPDRCATIVVPLIPNQTPRPWSTEEPIPAARKEGGREGGREGKGEGGFVCVRRALPCASSFPPSLLPALPRAAGCSGCSLSSSSCLSCSCWAGNRDPWRRQPPEGGKEGGREGGEGKRERMV